jgi:DNA end-binding protein Ku
MRSLWNGTISFGMMVIPVRLGTAASSEDLPLHQVRRADGSLIGYRRYAKADGADVESSDVAKGYETPDGRMVVLEDADFTLAYGEKNRSAQILSFTGANTLPRTAHRQSYLVEPGKGGEQSYALLAKVLYRQNKAGVVSIALGTRQALALLYATQDGYLTLERLQWAADVKTPDFAAPVSAADEKQLDIAENYISLLTKPFDWASVTDPSMEALSSVIQSKLAAGEAKAVPAAAARETGTATAADDMMAALLASVAAEKAKQEPAKPARTRRPRAETRREAA